MPGAPRPLKLTPKVHAAIVESIGNGAYVEPSCRAAGVSKDSYDRWLKRAEDPNEKDPRFARFAADIARAEAAAELELVTSIKSDEDWRAKAWVVGRRWSQRWSEKTIEEHVGPGGGPVEVAITHDDARAAYEALIAAGLVQPGPAALADPEA